MRRSPQQARAGLRRAKFIEVAAQLIGERGYEGVTMTAIADQAEASIGTLYDYFPDKATLALAIKAQYVQEIDEYWKVLLRDPSALTGRALADLFVEGALELIRKWPAYLPLLDAPVAFTRSAAARQPLRKTIAGALQAKNAKVSDEQAFIHAQVIVELIKSLLSVYRNSVARDRDAVAGEFKRLIRLYIVQILK
jgi:AcrR family transcriptional regulator